MHMTEPAIPPPPKKRSWGWCTLLVAFVVGFMVATAVGVYYDITPTGQAVKRLSKVNIDVTSVYDTNHKAVMSQLRLIRSQLSVMVDDTVVEAAEPQPVPVFDEEDAYVCMREGKPHVCIKSGNWVWNPPLADGEWEICTTDEGYQVPCGIERQPDFTGLAG